jgi:hypothetical protein
MNASIASDSAIGTHALGHFSIELISLYNHLRDLRVSNFGGGDVLKLEPRRLDFRSVDKMVRDLRRIYKENPVLVVLEK